MEGPLTGPALRDRFCRSGLRALRPSRRVPHERRRPRRGTGDRRRRNRPHLHRAGCPGGHPRRRLHAGGAPGRPRRRPDPLRHGRPVRGDPRRPGGRRGVRAGRRRRPGRARPAGVREADVAVLRRDASEVERASRPPAQEPPTGGPPPTTTPGSSSPPARPARPRASRSPTARPPRSWTPRRGCSCRTAPLGPGDRVLAGLSVAFDASCEEMWLAWAHGACLVPAPRALVRSGMDLGPWLVAQRHHRGVHRSDAGRALAGRSRWTAVRLLIFGGEACPPELAARLAVGGREVWNTYGPTEATVVACAARLAAPARCASGCRWTAGTWPWWTATGGRSRRATSAS